MKNRRVLGVDPGEKRIGLALSDETGTVATPLVVLDAGSKGFDEIARLVTEHSVKEVVVGLPLSLDGTEGPSSSAARVIAGEIGQRVNIPVNMFDERLTTVAAGKAFERAGVSEKKRRGKLDKVAAALLLQSYLDRS